MEKGGEECITYTQTIVPNTMRSTYWKYFGFPGNDNQEILTKNKVVCTLCNKVISYNKNTSNLRTHLFAKHPEKLFGMSCTQTPEAINKTKTQIMKVPMKKGTHETEDFAIEIIEENYDGYIPDQAPSQISIAHHEKSSLSDHINFEEAIDQATIGNNKSVKELIPCSNHLVDVVVKDLVDPRCFTGEEFRNFLSRNNLSLEPNELENTLREEYETVSIMETLPSDQYSLGLEVFQNFEGSKYLNVFLTVLEDTALKTKIFDIIKYENESTLEELMSRINLNNCSAVVISSDIKEKELEIFFIVRDIPIVYCLHSVLKKVIGRVFKLDVINQLIIELAKSSQQPIPKDPWKVYKFLSSWTSQSTQASSLMKILQQLEMTLDVLSEEALQVCSLLKPLSDQLLIFLPEDGEFVEVCDLIKNELKTILQQNNFLNTACFLDPRFQTSMSAEDLQTAKTQISSQISSSSELELIEQKPLTQPERKSGLKMFFNRGKSSTSDSDAPQIKVRKTSLSVELSNYSLEAALDVEYCPLNWWNENKAKYKLLGKMSNKYFCVPCFYRSDMKLKVNDIVKTDNKRFFLSDEYFKDIWFLHNQNK